MNDDKVGPLSAQEWRDVLSDMHFKKLFERGEFKPDNFWHKGSAVVWGQQVTNSILQTNGELLRANMIPPPLGKLDCGCKARESDFLDTTHNNGHSERLRYAVLTRIHEQHLIRDLAEHGGEGRHVLLETFAQRTPMISSWDLDGRPPLAQLDYGLVKLVAAVVYHWGTASPRGWEAPALQGRRSWVTALFNLLSISPSFNAQTVFMGIRFNSWDANDISTLNNLEDVLRCEKALLKYHIAFIYRLGRIPTPLYTRPSTYTWTCSACTYLLSIRK